MIDSMTTIMASVKGRDSLNSLNVKKRLTEEKYATPSFLGTVETI